ncbi:hypothetical protein CJF32_00008758 [Rutstroemia sp. NJR-2017a WRK4]|nr:hypothetical protein CJF32_00008758 [Rutstroemia sp. NJR-2017a WRK4]
MSNSSKSKHPKGKNVSLATPWSDWGLDEYNREVRYRLNDYGQFEYDYNKEAYNSQQNAAAVPITSHTNSLEPTAEVSAGRYYTSNRPLSSVTNSLAQTSLTTDFNPVLWSENSTTTDTSYPSRSNVRTSNPNANKEEFDPRFKVHRSSEFKWGRIFKVLWTEPKGNGGESSTGGSRTAREGLYGQPYYSKVRRFLIIKEEQGHCICLPILTYRAQGTNKNGVRANHHAIIYTEQPDMMYGELERGLTRRPIRVIPSEPQHKLDPASRLNYAKIYTVEHNVKVWFIGKLAPESEEPVVTNYNEVNPPAFLPGPSIPVATGSKDFYASGTSEQFLVGTEATPQLQLTIKLTIRTFQGIVHNPPAQYFVLSSLNT